MEKRSKRMKTMAKYRMLFAMYESLGDKEGMQECLEKAKGDESDSDDLPTSI